MNNNEIKILIELSTDFEKADSIISKYTDLNSDKEKIIYLYNMFGCKILDENTNDLHTDYKILLTSIINKKWM